MDLDPAVKAKSFAGASADIAEGSKAMTLKERQLPITTSLQRPKQWTRLLLVAGVIIAGGAAGAYWWSQRVPPLPPGMAADNGRLEADEIDIQTKFAGRLLRLLVDEDDLVKGGQALAIMDTSDLQAQLSKAEAQVWQARQAAEEANSYVEQLQAQLKLAPAGGRPHCPTLEKGLRDLRVE